MDVVVSSRLSDFADAWPVLEAPWAAATQPPDAVQNCEPHHAYAFQTREVLQIWLETIGAARGTTPLFVRVTTPAGAPVLLLPLGLERRRGVRVLGFLDGGVCDYNAPILFPAAAELTPFSMRRLWTRILARLPRHDLVVLEKIPAFVGRAANPLQMLAMIPDRNSGHVIDLARAASDANSALQPVRYSDSGRKRRRLAAMGTSRFVVASTPAEVDRALDVMIRQKSRRYIETRGVDGFDRPGYRAYYRTMSERLAASGGVQLSLLEANGTPIAAHWGIVTRERFYSLMPSFEAGEWSKCSPGLLHLEDMIQWCCDNGIATVDLGVGDEPYKSRIANATLPLFRASFAATLRGHAYLSAVALRSQLASATQHLAGKSAVAAPRQSRPRHRQVVDPQVS